MPAERLGVGATVTRLLCRLGHANALFDAGETIVWDEEDLRDLREILEMVSEAEATLAAVLSPILTE